MQLSYAPILGYSFDSTKVAKPTTADSSGILEQPGAIGTGGTEKQTAEMMIPPQKSGGPNKVRQGQRLRILA